MFENTIQTNGTQSWKWVTISGRVFVDNTEIEQGISSAHDVGWDRSENTVFEELARDRLIDDVFRHADEPFKLDSIEFPA